MGGYVKIACLISADMDRMAQLKIGDSMKFEKVTVDEARDILKQKAERASEESIEKI
jgi:allophanate hydrolase subunit 2